MLMFPCCTLQYIPNLHTSKNCTNKKTFKECTFRKVSQQTCKTDRCRNERHTAASDWASEHDQDKEHLSTAQGHQTFQTHAETEKMLPAGWHLLTLESCDPTTSSGNYKISSQYFLCKKKKLLARQTVKKKAPNIVIYIKTNKP